MQTFGSILSAFLIAYAGVAAFAFVFQSRLLYFPVREITVTPSARGLTYEPVTLRTGDNAVLDAWWVPARQPRGVLLFCHGNAGNISHRLDSLAIFNRLGLSVLIFDYRGYGRSQGHPSEAGTYEDAAAAWRYLVTERAVDPRDIVLFGRSLGGAVAAWLAGREAPGALIVESTFTSVPDLGQELYPWLPVRWLARLRYDAAAYLHAANVPVLIVHSRDDEIIPFHHGERLYAAARGPKQLLVLRGDHNTGFLASGEAYVSGLDEFLRRHLGRSPERRQFPSDP